MPSDDRSPSAGNFTRWAVLLLVPVVLSAAAMPWVLGHLRTGRGGLGGGSLGGAVADSESPPEQPRHPEAPTAAEIEAATTSSIEAARLQQRNLESAEMYAPRGAKTTASGERLAPFQGFGLSIGTTPLGARVLVDGNDVGESPIVTTVDCEPGQDVEVVVEKRGFRSERRNVRCRVDALLELSVALGRTRGAR